MSGKKQPSLRSMTSVPNGSESLAGESRPDLTILNGIRQIIHAMDMHSRALSARYGVTGPQFACLYTLLEEGAMSQKSLGSRVHVGGSTITGIIDRLETKGLVQRLKDTVDALIWHS